MAPLLVQLAISAAVAVAGAVIRQALTPKPKARRPAASGIAPAPTNSLVVEAEPGGPQIGIFGHRRVGGRLIYDEKKGNTTYYVIAIAGAPLSSIHAVYVDNALVTIDGAGNVTSAPWAIFSATSMKIRLYDGSQVAADANMDAQFPGWTADHVGLRNAYAVVEINPTISPAAFDPVYKSGVPDFQFDVLGFKCYDPRNGAHNIADPSTWTYSSNATILRANYLIHELGAGLPTSKINWANVAAKANIDDELVPLLNGGTERRYSASLYWRTDERHEAVMDRLNQACAGEAYPQGAQWVFTTGSFDAVSATIVPDDYVSSGLQWSEETPLDSLYNGVRGTFTSPAHYFETRDFPAYQDAAARALDGRDLWLDLELSCVTSAGQAQRLARIAYNRARHGASAKVELKFKHFDTVAGDVVSITDPLAGFAARTYRVNSDSLSGAEHVVSLDLEHERADFYNWTAATDEQDFQTYDPVLGEPGSLLAPGGIVVDTNVSGTQAAPNLRILPSASQDVTHYSSSTRVNLNGTVSGNTQVLALGSSNFTSHPSYNLPNNSIDRLTITAQNGDAASATRFSPAVDALGGAVVALSAINGLNETTSTLFILPACATPYLLSSSAGSARIRLKAHVVLKADEIQLLENTTNNSATATVIATVANVDSTQTVSGTPGTIKYYWTRLRNTATGKVGSFSNPVLVVF